jgi:hypothetical protein
VLQKSSRSTCGTLGGKSNTAAATSDFAQGKEKHRTSVIAGIGTVIVGQVDCIGQVKPNKVNGKVPTHLPTNILLISALCTFPISRTRPEWHCWRHDKVTF